MVRSGEREGRMGSAGLASHACTPHAEFGAGADQHGSGEPRAERARAARQSKLTGSLRMRRKPKEVGHRRKQAVVHPDENGEARNPGPNIEMGAEGNFLCHAIGCHANQIQQAARGNIVAAALEVERGVSLGCRGRSFRDSEHNARRQEMGRLQAYCGSRSVYDATLVAHAVSSGTSGMTGRGSTLNRD